MSAFATVTDVEALWRPLSEQETKVGGRLLAFASNLVRSRVPTVDKHIDDGTLQRDLVRDIVATMVKRVLANPEGWKSQTVGPFSAIADANVAAGYLYVSADELAVLQPKSNQTSRTRRGSVQLAAPLAPAGTEDYYRLPW